MISILQGEVLEATPLSAVISAGGVGYEVRMPVTTASRLPGIGKQARLFTMVVYREDEHALYGFSTKDEREFFRLLVEKVSGIGPKIALALMSKLSLPLLAGAIAGGDINLLAQTPGIGKKTAERIVVELRDKVLPGAAASSGTSATPGASASAPAQPDAVRDAVAALLALGYKLPEADKAVQKALERLGPGASTQDLVKRAFGP